MCACVCERERQGEEISQVTLVDSLTMNLCERKRARACAGVCVRESQGENGPGRVREKKSSRSLSLEEIFSPSFLFSFFSLCNFLKFHHFTHPHEFVDNEQACV